jgi:membrane protease YdiL (CAAX protease family)
MEHPRESRPDLRRWFGVLLALVFPTFVTWAYFFQAAGSGQGVQQAVMATLKVVQFALPLVWTWFVLGERIEWQRLTGRGIGTGLGFGVAVVVVGWFVYEFGIAGTSTLIAAADEIRAKVAEFGIDSVPKYVALAAFYSLAHSLLEEYYWRWFVFGQLRRLVPRWPAILISSLGFMAHHVLVLSHYFGWWTPPALLLSAAVAIGGAFWAWLYDRTGSLVGPWISHLVIDAGIFFIGYQIVRTALI